MAPIRRYLRISKYSALEVRIYLEKPSDTPWLLSSRDPALPRIIKLVRPKVLPKLREENENSKKKGKKKKSIKDVASTGDFEVAMFLTDNSTRHSLVTKHKQFADKPPIRSTGNKLTGLAQDDAIDLSKDGDIPGLRKEDTDGEADLANIPAADDSNQSVPYEVSSDDEAFQPQPPKTDRRRRTRLPRQQPVLEDDKKKMTMSTTYDSFSIYGKILCLIVKRRGFKATPMTEARMNSAPAGTQMIEQWVSTQADAVPGLEAGND